jgi:hypothetical protein
MNQLDLITETISLPGDVTKMRGGLSRIGTGYSLNVPMLITISILLHTHLSPPSVACDSPNLVHKFGPS